ncbi:hypothetical protein [Pseudanabaena sp. UWO310]|uniref:hypothetical protein n=1 Tax=Pseudanabaena sp. UWO310 TaxID=2480795 RepID=UPI0016810549|nr:hypothetical protein [Pseudanabaena sp. UWO310]
MYFWRSLFVEIIDAIAYLYLAYILTFEAIIFVYKALLAIALDDDKRRSPQNK